MDWIGWLGLGGGTLAVIGTAVFAALNPLRALALAKDIGAFLLDKARAFVAWARDPARNWWKIGCVSLASVCALLAWYAEGQRREVIIVQEKCAAEKVGLEQDFRPVREAAFRNFTELQSCVAELAKVVGEDRDTDRLNAEAVAKAEAKARQASQEAAKWRQRYEARPDDCKAALNSVEAKCAALSNY